jgi:hypothetical protein
MRMKISAALACLAVGLISLTSTANAAPISWSIVSSASTISLAIPNQTITVTSTANIILSTSQTVSLRALNPGTASGSTPTGWTIGNKENIQGTILADYDGSNIQFLAPNNPGTNIAGIETGLYAPLPDGTAGTAPADFATRIFAGAGALLATLNVDLAIRDVLYQLTSGVLPISSGTFTVGGASSFGLEDAAIAYRARNGGGLGGGALVDTIGGGSAETGSISTTNTAAGLGTYTQIGNSATIVVPITQTLVVPLDEDGLLFFKLNVSGTIVATAIVPEPATVGMLAVGMAMLAPVAVRRWRKRA